MATYTTLSGNNSFLLILFKVN